VVEEGVVVARVGLMVAVLIVGMVHVAAVRVLCPHYNGSTARIDGADRRRRRPPALPMPEC
jgi:hypothetical protein